MRLDPLDGAAALDDSTEADVLPVEVLGLHRRKEELAAVGVWFLRAEVRLETRARGSSHVLELQRTIERSMDRSWET